MGLRICLCVRIQELFSNLNRVRETHQFHTNIKRNCINKKIKNNCKLQTDNENVCVSAFNTIVCRIVKQQINNIFMYVHMVLCGEKYF